ncbi:MAG: sulfotransferase [Proteobacteria bacterium]|nr:sulfotransferase [Pseudomonadota bacterium]
MDTHRKKQILRDINSAIKFSEKQQHQKALIILNNYLHDLPDDLEIIVQYAQLCNSLGETSLAIDRLFKAVEIKPDNVINLGLLGSILLEDKQYQEADAQLRKALEISPRSWKLLANLGAVNTALGSFDDAIHFLKEAQSLKPNLSKIHENLAICMLKTDCYEEALKCAKKAIGLDPNNSNAHNIMGYTLSNMGKIPESIRYLEKAIQLDKFRASNYVNLVRVKNFSSKDQSIINKLERILEGSMSSIDRSYFCFALGKIYDDCEDWDKAFFFIKQANMLAKSQTQENPVSPRLLKSLKRVFSKDIFEKVKPLGNQSYIPIFIVGMPRSGTSLIEQIISSHPDAAGAGELTHIQTLADSIGSTNNPKQYQADFNKILNKQSIDELSTAYLDVLHKNREEASRVTDKLPGNYLHLGLITVLFPNAKIIHVARSPLDTCISCYFQVFMDSNLSWTYDPQWIADRYHSYQQVIRFWRGVLPKDKIFELQYEQLINNPEPNIRRILDYCNLNWNHACLDFHKTENIVKTASVLQVRQPIYKSSIQRWKRYGSQVQELATGLAEYLDDTDKQYLAENGVKIKSKKWWH